MRAAGWLVVWLLSPSRGALVPKCIFIGLVLEVLWLAVLGPIVWLVTGGSASSTGDLPGQPVSGRMIADAVLVGPVLETLLMAAVFGVLGRLLNLKAGIPGITVVLGAVALHDQDWGTTVFVAFMFTAFSIQYVRFRAFVPVNTAVLGVALTHGTVNLLSLAATLLA